MHALSFLAALPAILGIAGFFAYLWAGQSRIGGEASKAVIDKLRTNPNLDIAAYGKLTPARIAKLIDEDAKLKSSVNQQDRDLLRFIVVIQHIVTVIVILVSAGLIAWSVWLVARPQPLAVTVNAPRDVAEAAKGFLVDLDPLRVDWTATGKDEQVSVFLENVDSQARTSKHNLASNVRNLTFESSEILKVATKREYRGKNRVRAIVEWAGGTSYSEAVDVAVGLNVELALFGRVVGSSPDRAIHTLITMIDLSTENLPADYCFTGSLVCVMPSGPSVVPLKSCNRDPEVQVPRLEDVRWDKPHGFVYDGPDDPRLVRTKVSGEPR